MTSPRSTAASHSYAEQCEELRGSHLVSSSEVEYYLHCSLLQYPSAALLAKTELGEKKSDLHLDKFR